MRVIALEEHYRSPALREAAAHLATRGDLSTPPPIGRFDAELDEIGEKRIADMDAAGIDVQVLSHAVPSAESFPTEQAVPLAQAANDHLARAVAAHPTRFAGLATLPMPAPQAAADELERAVGELGLKGAMINGHTDGRFLDDRFFWPVLERANRLDVPIYLHPAEPPESVRAAYYDGLPEAVGHMLATAAWGWHVDTGLHVLRMVVGGVFDEFPRLQLIVGHMGEALPFMLARASHMLAVGAGLDKPIERYVTEHVHFNTSGMFSYPPLLCLLMVAGADRVMFGVDYPYAPNEAGRDFLQGAPISQADREKIAYRNAERLLRLEPATE
jgi:predicted TIM-barrel fold metal-dependent hydrolase